MAKPKPLPMPIETVLHSRHMQFAAGSVHRTVIAIACQFWAGGAVLDGFDEAKAAQIGRIPSGHWQAIKAPVMAALGDILPELAMRHAVEHEKRLNMRRSLEAGQLKGRIVMFERRQKQNAATVEKSPAAFRGAQTARKYVNETHPMSPQALAALPVSTMDNARLADK